MKYAIIFALALFLFPRTAVAQTCYVRLADASGYTPTAGQLDTLEQAAAALCAVFDSAGFGGQFKVYDFGFYLHHETTTGGYPEPFARKVAEVAALSPYYLLFGKQSDRSGVYTRFWVDMKLPDTSKFECIELVSSNMRGNLLKKYSAIANSIYENNKYSPRGYHNAEVNVMDSVAQNLLTLFKCCDLYNKGQAGCNLCVYTQSEFVKVLKQEYGFAENNCVILKKYNNDLLNEDTIFNRLVYEDGDVVDVDTEISRIVTEFKLTNPTLSAKVFRFKYPSNCNNIESLLDDYYFDQSDSKMIIGLIGDIGKSGSILWKTDGISPLHKDSRDFGYSVSKKQNGKGYDVRVTLNIKVINLSSNVAANTQTLASAINSRQPFDGDFTLNYKNEWLTCTGTTLINPTGVINSGAINMIDHILAIVDDIPESTGHWANPVGLAEDIGGSVAAVEVAHISTPRTSLHEIGHLLGLRDDYTKKSTGTGIMGTKPGSYFTTSSDRLDLYGPFIFMKDKNGAWRNRDKDITGNSIDKLKNFLRDNNIKYDKSKL